MKMDVSNDRKAVFLDRDGVINELVYHQEQGIIDSPFTVKQFNLLPGVGEAIKRLSETGYKVILASNQPGIAKGHMSEETSEKIRMKMNEALAEEGAFLDGEYYCFHHPEAVIRNLAANCECRKPNPGLLLKAAREMDINLSQSWMIGDGLTDVQAGKGAGCRTILLGRLKCEVCHYMDAGGARPDAVASNLSEAVQLVLEQGG